MKRGKYELKKRAERQEQTRLRIARATLELHEILGPALTTRSAIAQRAGVTRPTVYSHFPDEFSLGKACSSLELSDYFRSRERLWTNILRDQEMPLTNDDPQAREADAEIMEPIFLHWERMKQSLTIGWGASEESPLLVLSAIGLALDFQTWRAMARTQDLSDEQAIELMAGMVRCAAGVAGSG